jgi:hypothetical protein
MVTRYRTPILLVCAAVGVACGSERIVDPEITPIFTTLEVSPGGATVLQGGSSTAAATLRRSRHFSGTVNLTVAGAPTGVAAVVSDVQNTSFMTTATVTLNVSSSTVPGVYSLVIRGTAIGTTDARAAFVLTVEPIAPCSAGGLCEQWAVGATASSEYSANAWSANQATGWPNAIPCEDDGRAWASSNSDGIDWLELVYPDSVRPTEIRIHEVLGVSSIVKVEVKDGAGNYHTVHTAQSGSQTCPRILTIPVTGISAAVKVVRLSLDQRALNQWNEIDAVKLIGQVPVRDAGITGVYDLTAPITNDPAWGLAGCHYTAVLTIQQSGRDRFEGTYADLQFICPREEPSDWHYTGFVSGSIDLEGQVRIYLVGGNHKWTSWGGEGKLVSQDIVGKFDCCDQLSGTFIAKRRQAD